MKKMIPMLFLFSVLISAQSNSYDGTMRSIAKEMAIKTRSKNKVKIALWYFTDTRGQKSSLGDYIARDFSVYFTEQADVFEVFDRDHLGQYLQEHQLNEAGFINPQTAKTIGMLTAADAIVTGTVDVSLHQLRLRIKLINTETGGQIAALIRNIPIDKNLETILDDVNFKKQIRSSYPRTPNPSEIANDSNTTNKECMQMNTGDYCYKNTSNQYYLIDIVDRKGRSVSSVTVGPNTTECFYGLRKGDYVSKIYPGGIRTLMGDAKGTIRVNTCESNTKIIR